MSSRVFANYILATGGIESKNVLDMGCGTGIVGLAVLTKKAHCTAIDINPEAVKSANENFKLNGFDSVAEESDLFDNMAGSVKFDIIYFNPPYYNYEPRNDYERAFGGGKDYKVIRRFLEQSKNRINDGGYICMLISSDMGIDVMVKILQESGFSHNILHVEKRFFETFYIVKAFFEVTK